MPSTRQSTTYGLFSQTGGSANFTSNFYVNFASASGGIADVSGGTLTHSSAGNFMATGAGGPTGTGVGVLTVRGGGYVQEQTGNFFVTNASSGVANGIVNVISGGTLEVNKIQKATNASAVATVNFDGGTLRAYANNTPRNLLSGMDNAFLYPGGVTIDPNNQNVTIGQTLSAPAGYGVGTSGGTIFVASGGSGYLAPPVVTFAAPAGGVAATGVAQIDGNGTVTGILVTSPGSGYTNGQSVAVSFNGGNNAANEAVAPAAGFNTNASTQNTSGGLSVAGSGTLTLSATNTYSGPTSVNSGTLLISGALNPASAVFVATGATFGGTGSAGTLNVASGGIIQGGVRTNNSGSLTLAGLAFNGQGILSGTLGSSTASAAPIIVNGALTSSGGSTVTINVSAGTQTAIGTYHFLKFGSLPSFEGYGAFTFSPPVRAFTLVTTDAGYLDINYNTSNYPIWTGVNGTGGTSGTATFVGGTNWKVSSGGAPTDFLAQDNVVFDDSAGTAGGADGQCRFRCQSKLDYLQQLGLQLHLAGR